MVLAAEDIALIAKLTRQLHELELQSEKAPRRAARLAAKAQTARQDAMTLGILAHQEGKDVVGDS